LKKETGATGSPFTASMGCPDKLRPTMNDPLPLTPPNSRVKIMTIPEIVKLLRLSETTVRRMCERKELPAVKFGSQWRIRETDVLAMFDQPA
jgi:excisionase family DNA binding protein